MMQDASLCALGRTAPNPVLTTIKFFREEYEEHIGEHRLPAALRRADQVRYRPASMQGLWHVREGMPH